MKSLKSLFLLAASVAMLTGCGTNEPSVTPSASEPTPSETSTAKDWEYLNFLGSKVARFDLFDIPEGLEFKYGDQVLSNGVQNLTINNSSKLSVNKNLTHEDSLHLILVAEKEGTIHAYMQVLQEMEGDHLTDLFNNGVLSDVLNGYDRSYVTLSTGEKPQWTKGLNEAMDRTIEALISKKDAE